MTHYYLLMQRTGDPYIRRITEIEALKRVQVFNFGLLVRVSLSFHLWIQQRKTVHIYESGR